MAEESERRPPGEAPHTDEQTTRSIARRPDPTAAHTPPCRCLLAACDRPDPHACPVHGELHRLVCEG